MFFEKREVLKSVPAGTKNSRSEGFLLVTHKHTNIFMMSGVAMFYVFRKKGGFEVRSGGNEKLSLGRLFASYTQAHKHLHDEWGSNVLCFSKKGRFCVVFCVLIQSNY